MAALRGLPSVAGVDGHALQHTRVAVAVNHAPRAAVADELGLVQSYTLHIGVSQKWQR